MTFHTRTRNITYLTVWTDIEYSMILFVYSNVKVTCKEYSNIVFSKPVSWIFWCLMNLYKFYSIINYFQFHNFGFHSFPHLPNYSTPSISSSEFSWTFIVLSEFISRSFDSPWSAVVTEFNLLWIQMNEKIQGIRLTFTEVPERSKATISFDD